jgi:conjugal transfer mating pair stabilization protein TraG
MIVMGKLSTRKYIERRLRKFRKKYGKHCAIGFSIFAVLASLFVYLTMKPQPIQEAAYTPLLNTIADGESNGNYNAYFGNSRNVQVRFTSMTLQQVLDWQKNYVNGGSPSSAVGRYQIVRPTMLGLIKELELNLDEKFDKTLQDRMAITLLERRGARDFVEDKLTREQFAANLAKEWAALPRITGPNPTDSYYAADGLNKSRIGIEEIYGALHRFRLNV